MRLTLLRTFMNSPGQFSGFPTGELSTLTKNSCGLKGDAPRKNNHRGRVMATERSDKTQLPAADAPM
jgi:hypothetical protein